VPDRRVRGQRGLDLGGLHAVAADLDLVVGAAPVVQATGSVAAHQVAGAVHPLPRHAERVGDEPLRREPASTAVAAGDTGPRDVQLTLVRGSQVRAQDVLAGVAHGHADLDRAGSDGRARLDPVGDAPDRDLGRAVLVDHHDTGVPGAPAVEDVARQRLAADDQVAGGRDAVHQVEHQRQVAGRRLEERHPQRVLQCAGDHATPDHQRPPQGRDGQVHGDRGVQQRLTGEAGVVGAAALQVARELPVLDLDALGAARRAGRVDHVGEVLRDEVDGRRRVGVVLHGVPVEVEPEHPVDLRGREVALGQQQRHPRVGQRVRDPVGGVGGVDRQVGAARLHHGQQGDHQLRAPVGAHPDHDVRPDPASAQRVRQPVGPDVELGVVEHAVRRPDGGRGGTPTCLLVEQVGQDPRSSGSIRHADPHLSLDVRELRAGQALDGSAIATAILRGPVKGSRPCDASMLSTTTTSSRW
jgi:hypothetical protein